MPKKTPTTLQASLVVRLGEKNLKTFKQKSLKTTGKPYQLLVREFVDAFNEDRLRIISTADQTSTTGVLYNVD